MPDPALDMSDPEWRRALELLARSADRCTAALLFANGFESTVIAGLVESGLANWTIEVALAGGRPIDVRRLRLTDSGRNAMER